jgi:hypothetical protein
MGSGQLQVEDILKKVSISAVFGYHHGGGACLEDFGMISDLEDKDELKNKDPIRTLACVLKPFW